MGPRITIAHDSDSAAHGVAGLPRTRHDGTGGSSHLGDACPLAKLRARYERDRRPEERLERQVLEPRSWGVFLEAAATGWPLRVHHVRVTVCERRGERERTEDTHALKEGLYEAVHPMHNQAQKITLRCAYTGRSAGGVA